MQPHHKPAGTGSSTALPSLPICPTPDYFHVFLSFRGLDVRNTFLSHLHRALKREGIRAYVDGKDLRCGDAIIPSLKKAIWSSRIAIVVFSINYASSRWCLDELVEIMDRRKQGKLVVKLVFYRVEPREVRMPRGSFAKALAAHELKLGKYSHVLRRWREALLEAGYLSGWHLDENRSDGNEAELIDKIVRDVNVVLDRMLLDVAKYPVGIESQVTKIKNMLNLESNEVLLVGIWGMGGVGKTTLGKALFNIVADRFEACAFLPDVREHMANPIVGLVKLQEKLLSQVLGRSEVNVHSIAGGIARIKDRLRQIKVLLFLDDVNSGEQLEALAGGLDWFGNGSRILVTTRDRSILRARDIRIIHEVEGLPHMQALKLFSKHAFAKNDGPNISRYLVDRFLTYCRGLPLALVGFGFLLRNQEEKYWESMLKLLEQQGPCQEIEKVLRVGFDELDQNAQEVFLVIACFFAGETRWEIEKAMDACGFVTSLAIDVLIEKSLVTIVEDTTCGMAVDRVEMHPLLQLTGRNIARHGNPKSEYMKHVRQWPVRKRTRHVLSNGMAASLKTKAAVVPIIPGNAQCNGDPGHKLNVKEGCAYSAPDTSFSKKPHQGFRVHDSGCPRAAL